MSKRRKWKAPITFPRLDAREIGRRIRTVQKRLFWSSADLARVADMPIGTLSSFQCGCRLPSRDSAVRLALALGLTLDYLILGKHSGKGKTKEGADVGAGTGDPYPATPARSTSRK